VVGTTAPPLGGPEVIRWQDVTVRLGDQTVLAGVTLEVPQGQRLALVGPNGAGKTTLLRCLLDLVPYEGQVTIGPYDARKDGSQARRLMGYVPQVPAFPLHLTAAEVVALVQELRGQVPDPWSILEELGLGAHGYKPVRQLSGGMLRRLSLAAALAADPPVLVLDEPTSYLDREGEAWLWARLERTGKTVVLAGHRLRGWERLVDRIVLLEDGRIAADVRIEELDRLHWVEVVVPGPIPGPLPPGVEVLVRPNEAIHLRVPDGALVTLLPILAGRRFRLHEPTLEEILRVVRR
jgi:ABC-2 type transport system ATP-binding protein